MFKRIPLFFNKEESGGLVLVCVTLISLFISNSIWQTDYLAFWDQRAGEQNITGWINDGLMAIFFLYIGLELEEEIYIGQLSSFKKASLPIFAALGGMLLPAGLYLLLNSGSGTQSGAGIPMATDIAFALGILSLLGKRVPASLRIFLTALAVMDDLGAILIIAVFYTGSLSFLNLFIALGILLILIFFNRLGVKHILPYLAGGLAMWYFMHHSGVHATISGVLLAMVIPFGKGDQYSPSARMKHFLHKPVTFFILPLFAMANTCIVISELWYQDLFQVSSSGILLGLVIGKPIGILLLSYLGVLTGYCALPKDLSWKNILGAGMLGGIGFTMSIFITLLAYSDPALVNSSKIAILMASFLAGTFGFVFLKLNLKVKKIGSL